MGGHLVKVLLVRSSFCCHKNWYLRHAAIYCEEKNITYIWWPVNATAKTS